MNIKEISLHPGILYQSGCIVIGDPVSPSDDESICAIVSAAGSLNLDDIPSIWRAVEKDYMQNNRYCLTYTCSDRVPRLQWIPEDSINLLY